MRFLDQHIIRPLVNMVVKWLPLIVVGLGVSVGPLDTSVNIAFPEITSYFNIPIAEIQWVIISFVLTSAALQLGFGRIGDMIGHKKVFIAGLAWSGFSFLLCGYASSFELLLLARCMQGLGAALIFSCAPALATLNFPEKERGKVLGGFYLFLSTALALGPMIGGQLIAHWGWPAVFFFRVPIACLAVISAVFLLKQPAIENENQSFDWQGWLGMILFIGALLFAVTRGPDWGWISFRFFALMGVAAIGIVFFIFHTLRVREPLINLRFFGNAGFSLSNLAFILAFGSSFFIFLLVPYYLVTYLKVSASTGGFMLAMTPAGTMVSSLLGGYLLARVSTQKLRTIGIVICLAGLLGISRMHTDSMIITIVGILFINGLGIGLFQVAHMDYVMNFIPIHQRGVAGSLTITMNTIGVFLGATLGTFVFDHLKSHYTTLLANQAVTASDLESQVFISAFHDTFLLGAVLAIAALILLGSNSVKKYISGQ